jgi:hypothetical protein
MTLSEKLDQRWASVISDLDGTGCTGNLVVVNGGLIDDLSAVIAEIGRSHSKLLSALTKCVASNDAHERSHNLAMVNARLALRVAND